MSEIAGNDQFKTMSAAHGMIATWAKLFKRLNEDANGGFMIPHETMSEATIAMNTLHKYMDLSSCLQLLEDVRAVTHDMMRQIKPRSSLTSTRRRSVRQHQAVF